MPTDARLLEEEIKRKLQELAIASENEKQFLGHKMTAGEKVIPQDFFKMAEAFDTSSLKNIELDILLTKQHKVKGWEKTLEVLEIRAKELRDKIAHWKKREFPAEID